MNWSFATPYCLQVWLLCRCRQSSRSGSGVGGCSRSARGSLAAEPAALHHEPWRRILRRRHRWATMSYAWRFGPTPSSGKCTCWRSRTEAFCIKCVFCVCFKKVFFIFLEGNWQGFYFLKQHFREYLIYVPVMSVLIISSWSRAGWI